MAKRWRGMYYHHGIDMDDGTVIHLDGEPLRRKNSRVCSTAMEDFLQGNPKIVVTYDDAIPILTAEETAEKARDLLDQDGYSLFRKNCEHFATFCKTGKAASHQVKFYVRLGSIILLIGVSALGMAAGKGILGKIAHKRNV